MTEYSITKDLTLVGADLVNGDVYNLASVLGQTLRLTINETVLNLPQVIIFGSAGTDILEFNIGSNTITGIYVDNWSADDQVIVNGTAGADNLGRGVNSMLQFVPDVLRGLGGNDTMIGHVAGDRLFGGSQDDTLILQGLGIRAFGGTGTDVLQADFSADLDTRVTMDLTDGGGGRVVQAGTRISEIEAFRGKLSSYSDTFTGGIGRDEVNGWRGKDTLNGGEGTDILMGGDDADVMNGGAGRDVLIGESGADVLTGGLGADRFVFAGGDSGFGAQRDQVTDFEQGRDKIDLIRMAGIPGSAGYDPFTFIGETLFLPGYGTQVGFEVVGATTVIQFYDDERMMGEIVLQGVFDLKATDFIL